MVDSEGHGQNEHFPDEPLPANWGDQGHEVNPDNLPLCDDHHPNEGDEPAPATKDD